MENTIVCDTPEKIAFFNLCALRGALRLESAGLKSRGKSAVSIAKKAGFKGKTAGDFYLAVKRKIKELNGEE